MCIRVCVRPVRKKWLSPFYSTYWCYIHQTCTNCSSWHELLMPHGGLCPWPTFHAWVTMVRKKLLSLYYSTYECYIHQTCTKRSVWPDLLMPRGGLCPWPTFHAWVTMVRKQWLSLYYSTYWCYIHQRGSSGINYILSYHVPVQTIVSPYDANCVTPLIYPTTDLDFLFRIIVSFDLSFYFL